jgi:hypothetical protein
MRMGPFISLLSKTYGLPESSVAVVARVMREAGWLTTGARGVNAPEMTAVDAARLTLALLSGETPGKVVEEFEFLRRLEATSPPPDTGFTAGSGLDQPHCLEDALIWLFGLTSATSTIRKHGQLVMGVEWIWPSVTVSLDASARAAQIYYLLHSCTYEDLAREREIEALPADLPFYEKWLQSEAIEGRSGSWDSSSVHRGIGMRVIRTIEGSVIGSIADSIAADSSSSVTGDQGAMDA